MSVHVFKTTDGNRDLNPLIMRVESTDESCIPS